MTPPVSVVIATYNRGPFLPRTIASVRAQTVETEIVVVDDASTDETSATLADLAGPDLIVLTNDRNRERSVSRNRGIEQASSPLVAMLDSDDEWLPQHLEDALELLGDPQVGLVYSPADFVRQGETVFTGPTRNIRRPAESLRIANRFAFSTVVMRRSIWAYAGGFRDDARLITAEDWEFWVRCASLTRFAFVPRATTRIHFHGDNSVRDVDRHVNALERAHELIGDAAPSSGESSTLRWRRRAWLLVLSTRAHLDAGDRTGAKARLRGGLFTNPSLLLSPAVQRTLGRVIRGREAPLITKRLP